MTPEFPRPQRLDQIGAGDNQIVVTANADERAALAERFGLLSIEALESRLMLRREVQGIVARGQVTAQMTQACVATGTPLPATITEDFAIRFLPEPAGGSVDDEVELSADECDIVFYTGNAIDLGEAAAETMALAIDPFPRSSQAAAVLRQAGVLSEDEAGPFSALAGLKEQLAKKQKS